MLTTAKSFWNHFIESSVKATKELFKIYIDSSIYITLI